MDREGGYIKLGPERRVHYIEQGEGSPVVFLPGHGCSVGDFGPVIRIMSQRYRCIAIDPPGRVPTDWPDERFELEADMPPVLDWVLSQLNVGPHVLIGHSSGGMSGLLHATRHPGLVKGLSLLEAFISLNRGRQTLSRKGMQLVRADDRQKPLFLQRRQINANWLNDHPQFRDSFWQSHQAFDLAPRVGELTMPVQFIIGDMGQLMPKETDLSSWQLQLGMEQVAELEVAIVPDAGHWMMLDDPPLVAKLLMGFVDQVYTYGSQAR